MTQPIIILLFVLIVAHDADGMTLTPPNLPGAMIAFLSLAPMALLAIASHMAQRWNDRSASRGLSARHLIRADRIVLATSVGALVFQTVDVLALGWLDVVRNSIGDLLFVDEAIATLPPLLVIIASWWSAYAIERRVKFELLARAVERGDPVHLPPTRRQSVLDRIRHQMLLTLAPLSIILAWGEAVVFGQTYLQDNPRWGMDPQTLAASATIAQLVGVMFIFLFSPFLFRFIWSTAPLPSGLMRDRLLALCRDQRVRCRQILLWRTHGTMINGAVMGLIGPLRFILLTDALLETLAPEQVEAVMAHEVGHIRRRHLPWLLLAMIASLGATIIVITWLIHTGAALLNLTGSPADGALAEGVTLLTSIVLGLIVFSSVSRLFERQADAFAVQHFSGQRPDGDQGDLFITADAAQAMSAALGSVARLNHVSPDKFTWRHGSIAQRQRAIESLVGRSTRSLPVDRTARRMKIVCLITIAALVAIAAMDSLGAPPWQ